MDVFDKKKRSEVMARVRSKDTKPEKTVRSFLHRRGFRYRLHDRRLPGAPDLVFPSRRTVVFVHGCFWHGHESCRRATMPSTRAEFWRRKILGNRYRDARQRQTLEASGWRVLVVWECEINEARLTELAREIAAVPTLSGPMRLPSRLRNSTA